MPTYRVTFVQERYDTYEVDAPDEKTAETIAYEKGVWVGEFGGDIVTQVDIA